MFSPVHFALIAMLSVGASLAPALTPVTTPDRRTVDTVIAGDAESEQMHGYTGHDDWTGIQRDRPFRQAAGWMRYAMTTFDDTEVTIACVFTGDRDATRHFDLIVEDSIIVRATLPPSDSATRTLEFRVPFEITSGRANIAVALRGREGPTPALRSLNILQDHHELMTATRRSGTMPLSRLTYPHHLSGAVR